MTTLLLLLLLLHGTKSDLQRILRITFEDENQREVVTELELDPKPDIRAWCGSLVDREGAAILGVFVEECVATVEAEVSKRFDGGRAIEYYSNFAADLATFANSQMPLAVAEHQGGAEAEDLDFVSSRGEGFVGGTMMCNTLSEIPARGRGAYGAMGPHLYRPAGGDGAIRFRNGVDEEIHVFLRLHKRYKVEGLMGWDDVNSTRFKEVQSKRETALATVEALSDALEFEGCKENVRVHVMFSGDKVADSWEDFVGDALGNLGKNLRIHRVREGNKESFQDMLSILRGLNLPDSAIVLLLEDDVMLRPSALVEMMEVFKSHEPCFVRPNDGAEDYTLGAPEEAFPSESIVVAGSRRHWKTAISLSVTYAARMGTLDYFAGSFPIPTNDFLRSRKLVEEKEVTFFSPLPTLALTTENLSDFTEPALPPYVPHEWARGLWEKAEVRRRRLAGGKGDEL
ncbi:hypothetical protein TrRE_jg11366 [Triparma retinervis]|uniref:Uncharacterized protein n=1 Tax=Triparma retinervis TaxID=2557542 RepID=A0A9W7L5A5_9STRA|nr:hypothetical protein TrRE_jg11366 [Triparma retinervis]